MVTDGVKMETEVSINDKEIQNKDLFENVLRVPYKDDAKSDFKETDKTIKKALKT